MGFILLKYWTIHCIKGHSTQGFDKNCDLFHVSTLCSSKDLFPSNYKTTPLRCHMPALRTIKSCFPSFLSQALSAHHVASSSHILAGPTIGTRMRQVTRVSLVQAFEGKRWAWVARRRHVSIWRAFLLNNGWSKAKDHDILPRVITALTR